ncbi:MAG TPA: helix-turn-helix domain-containing protein [Mycobacteriales bacterium]|nr:helix-turn-helix domain-containing protein [Mycobacteriales bacterium]
MSEPPGGRLRAENAVLRDIVTIYSELSGLASQDTDATTVVRLVAGRVGGAAAVVDAELEVLACASAEEPDPLAGVLATERAALARLVATAASTRRALTLPAADEAAPSVVVAPIILGDEPAAYLLTANRDEDGQGEDTRLMVTEHAAMICGIVLGRARVVAAAAGQARRELFEGLLLLGDRAGADADGWARHLGIKPDQRHRVLTTVFRSRTGAAGPITRETEVAAVVEHLLLTRCAAATVVNRGGEVVAVVAEPDAGPDPLTRLTAVATQCKTSVEGRFPGATVSAGIGNAYTGAARISTSYAEAKHALDTTALMAGLGGVVAFADLGISRLLARVRDVGDLRDFAHDVLGELLAHERAHGTDYLATLTVYFNENNSPQRSARRLHMHPNTVAYRVRRIEEITGLSLGSYSDRLMLQVALEIVNGLGDSG